MRSSSLVPRLQAVVTGVLLCVALVPATAAQGSSPVEQRASVFVDLAGTPSGRDVVLRGTVVGADQPVLERASCAQGCEWRRFATPAVPRDVFRQTVTSGARTTWWRVRAGGRTSWPISVAQREDDRAFVRERVATRPLGFGGRPTVDDTRGAIRWAKVDQCRTAGQPLVASGTVRNPSSATRDVVITISWANETSDVLAQDVVVVLDLPAGATRRWRAQGVAASGAEVAECVPNVVAGQVRG